MSGLSVAAIVLGVITFIGLIVIGAILLFNGGSTGTQGPTGPPGPAGPPGSSYTNVVTPPIFTSPGSLDQQAVTFYSGYLTILLAQGLGINPLPAPGTSNARVPVRVIFNGPVSIGQSMTIANNVTSLVGANTVNRTVELSFFQSGASIGGSSIPYIGTNIIPYGGTVTVTVGQITSGNATYLAVY